MKSNTKRVVEDKPREPIPAPAENSDIRPWMHIGEAAQIALSGIEHNMRKAHAELGEATLTAGKKLRAAQAAIGAVLKLID